MDTSISRDKQFFLARFRCASQIASKGGLEVS